MIKLVRKAKGLQSLIETLNVSIKPISNVGILLLLVFYLFSIVGNKLLRIMTAYLDNASDGTMAC
ncbi:MAG: ion transporter [Flammeovirgaceae bacterium]